MGSSPIPLPEVALSAGISTDKARHWVEALGFSLVKVGRVRHATPHAAAQVREMARLVAGGMSPQVAAAKLREVPVVEPQPAPLTLTTPDAPRLEEIGRALVALAEAQKVAAETHGREVAALREVVSRLVEENRALRSEVAGVRLALLPPTDPPRPVTPWQPEPRPDPLAGASWFRRVWVEMTAPERLRRFDS